MTERRSLLNERYVPRVIPGAKRGFALGFPNSYYCGMSNLGMQTIYRKINERGDTACERFFYEGKGIRPATIETKRSLADFPVAGISVNFEMDYFNLAAMIRSANIPLYAKNRKNDDVLLIGGGPCLTNNPEPVAGFFDVIVAGDGEDTVNDILDCIYRLEDSGAEREFILQELSGIPGVYVPIIKNNVRRRTVNDYAGCSPCASVIVAEETEFSNMLLLEIARGCGRQCRFCMAGYSTRPVRMMPLEKLKPYVDLAQRDGLRLGLVGCAVSDYPEIDELCNYITSKQVTFSVASLRADSVSDLLLKSLAGCGHRTVTFAPEAASERLRAVINKTISRRQLFDAVGRALNAGIPNIRLYFMTGLPGETDEDIHEMTELSREISAFQKQIYKRGKLTLSVNPFVPKPNTPFQRMPFCETRTLKARYAIITEALGKNPAIELKFEDIRQVTVQAMLARGGRELSALIAETAAAGGYKKWNRILKERQLDEQLLLGRIDASVPLPWQHIQCGVTAEYFAGEAEAAGAGRYTECCRTGCRKCGVCS